jgi:hypothetical protein
VKILNTNTLSLALLLALGAASPVQAMSYARSAWDYAKSTRAAAIVSTGAGKVASGASFLGAKAKAGASAVAGKSVELAQAVKNARVWSLAYNKAVAAHTILGNGMNKVSFGRFARLQASHPRVANAVMAATVAGATYAGYKGTKWAYNKAKAFVASRKQAHVKTEAPVVSVVTAPVVAAKAVRFADLNATQKATVNNIVEARKEVNNYVLGRNGFKRGAAYAGAKFQAETHDAVAQELFGKVTA